MIAANAPTPRNHPSNQFNRNDGIRPEFRGPFDFQGQIRHFIAAFIASAGYGNAGENFMNDRENPNDPDGRTDLAVNRLAFDIKRKLESPLSVGIDLAKVNRDFAREIRERFCTN